MKVHTWVMLTKIWKDLGYPALIPSTISLRYYYGCPSQLQGLYQNVPISLVGKKTIIDVKVVDAQLDYNILLGRSFVYAMKVVTSSLFRIMMFPHNENIITIDQLTYHEPREKGPPNNIISHLENHTSPNLETDPGMIKNSTLLGAYHRDPPII
jgi:hypothetical protein